MGKDAPAKNVSPFEEATFGSSRDPLNWYATSETEIASAFAYALAVTVHVRTVGFAEFSASTHI